MISSQYKVLKAVQYSELDSVSDFIYDRFHANATLFFFTLLMNL